MSEEKANLGWASLQAVLSTACTKGTLSSDFVWALESPGLQNFPLSPSYSSFTLNYSSHLSPARLCPHLLL